MPTVLLSAKNVGDTIYIKENNTAQAYLIVHKGSPDTSKYVGFDNGVVVLRTNIHSKGVYDSSNNDYANSDIHSWCNGTFLNTIQEDVRNQIMQVKIPYRKGTSGSSVSAGANGLSCKAFLLSTREVDSTESYSPNEGAVFSYFKGGGNSRRIARYNGQPDYWWLRSPVTTNYGGAPSNLSEMTIDKYGSIDINIIDVNSYGRRPAFVLPGSLSVDDSGNVVTNQPPTAPGSIDVQNVVSGGTTTITITAATDSDGTVSSYRYERSVDGGSFTQIANTSSLTYQDQIDQDWATVQYRVCAVDDMGSTGPYVTSENFTIEEGYIIISGPAHDMGTQDAPFTFTATIDVSGFTGTTGISVNAYVDGQHAFSETMNQGQQITFDVDTRAMASGSHTIRVVAEHSTVLPAMSDYTFNITAYTPPEGGRYEQFEDEHGNAIFPVMMSRYVISANNRSIQNDIDELKSAHSGLNGYLEHVDTVSGATNYTLTRESGTIYAVELRPPVASGNAQPMLVFCIPSNYTGSVTLGSAGKVNVKEGSVEFTMNSGAVLKIMKYRTNSQ